MHGESPRTDAKASTPERDYPHPRVWINSKLGAVGVGGDTSPHFFFAAGEWAGAATRNRTSALSQTDTYYFLPTIAPDPRPSGPWIR